jgi:acid phosphatase
MDNCSAWDYAFGLGAVNTWNAVYLPSIVSRFNELLPGFNFTQNHAHGLLYACAYETATMGSSPWCKLFTESEILDFGAQSSASPVSPQGD